MLIIGVLLLFFSFNVKAQDSINAEKDQFFETYRVQWVNQFPLLKEQKKKSNKGWFSRLVFGRKYNPQITKPVGILATSPDDFSVLDQGSGTLFKIKNKEKRISKILKKSKLNFPSLVDFCAFSKSEILFTDSRLNKVFRLNEKQKNIDVLNDDLQLQQPTGIAYSKISNEIWVVETGAHRISILDENGKLIKTIGKRGVAPGEFNFPTSIWIDKLDKVYVIDAMNFRLQILNKDGTVISVFGEPGNATGYFARPRGVATDSYGNIYITDALYHTVQIFDISGNYLYNFGKQGRSKEQFWMPSGIYIDDKNNIYVADSYNARIQIFQLIKGK